MPHELLIDLDHLEPAGREPSEARSVVSPVDDARVVQLALHLEDDGKVVGSEVDTTDPASASPRSTWRRNGGSARAPQDLLDP